MSLFSSTFDSGRSNFVKMNIILSLESPINALKCCSDCSDHPCVLSITNKIASAFENPAIVFLKKSLCPGTSTIEVISSLNS